LRFAAPAPVKPRTEVAPVAPAKRLVEKIDPTFLAAARELRDRYLERVNEGQLLLPAGAKYDVTRVAPTLQLRGAA
jgi:hypothetical protein